MTKTIVITGASDGIGATAARKLSADGHQIVIIGHSPDKTKAVANELNAPYYIVDFTRLDDVEALAEKLSADLPTIDVLVNNAGGIMRERQLTGDGFEKTLQVNYLAPFLLTNLLLPKLVENNARVINTSSVAHKLFAKLDINDLNLEHGYTVNRAYGNAKLANILFTKGLNTRFGKYGVTTAAFHPGNVATSFAADSTSPLRFLYKTFLKKFFLISPEKGADTLVWLATSQPGEVWQSGGYYYKRKPAKIYNDGNNTELATKLWHKSVVMADLDDDSVS